MNGPSSVGLSVEVSLPRNELAHLQERMTALLRAADELQSTMPPAQSESVGVIDDTALFRVAGAIHSEKSVSAA